MRIVTAAAIHLRRGAGMGRLGRPMGWIPQNSWYLRKTPRRFQPRRRLRRTESVDERKGVQRSAYLIFRTTRTMMRNVPINPAPVITMRIAKLNETFRSRFCVQFQGRRLIL